MGQPPRLLLIAYACSPFQGSERAVGWHRALGAAEEYETWVICEGAWCGPDIQRYLAGHGPIDRLHFVFVHKGPLLRALGRVPGLYYLAYRAWHRRAIAVARRLHEQRPFALVHQATFCGYREPGYAWQLGLPLVWGPLGGTQNLPWRFLGEAGLRGGAYELLRSALNIVQLRASRRVRRAVRAADGLLAANTTVAGDLAAARGYSPPVLLETGVEDVASAVRRSGPHDPFRILWCGELRPHKALPLLLRALGGLPRSCRFQLCVVGSGPELRRWQRIARRHGVEANTRWLGRLTHVDTLRQYQWADVLVFTSLRDTSGNVVLEALASGVPVIGLDHQGVRDIVTEGCGMKVPVTTPALVVGGIRDAIQLLSADAGRWRALSRGAAVRAADYRWSSQSDAMRGVYRRVLADASTRPQPARSLLSAASPVVRRTAKRAGGSIASCLNQALGSRAGTRFGILLYHRVASCVTGVPAPTHNVTPERFRQQLTGLLERGFTAARLEDLIDARRRRTAPPPKTFAITFDDAYEAVYASAWPVLRELGLPATVFVGTAFLDQREPFPFDRWARQYRDVVPGEAYRPITGDQCREMAASGLVSLGSHTHTHRDLRGRPVEFRADLLLSLRHLADRFGGGSWPLAFPFGHSDNALVRKAKAAGLTCALTTRAALVEPDADPFTWGRFNVYQSDTGATLAAKLQGWYTWLPAIEARLAGRS